MSKKLLTPTSSTTVRLPIRYRSMLDQLSANIWSQSQILSAGMVALDQLTAGDRTRLLVQVMSTMREDHNRLLSGKTLVL